MSVKNFKKKHYEITVIVLTKNSQAYINPCLHSVIKQSLPPSEIIVIDNNSKDNTVKIVKNYPVKVYSHSGNIAQGRNLGLKKSKGQYVAFIDSDCIAGKHWLKHLSDGINLKADIIGSQGNSVIANPKNNLAWIEEEFFQRFQKNSLSDHFYSLLDTKNCLLVKNKVVSLGGFDESLIAAEDQDLGLRIYDKGYKIQYVATANVQHFHQTSLRGMLRKKTRDNTGVIMLSLKRRDTHKLLVMFKELVLMFTPFLFLFLRNITAFYFAVFFWFIYFLRKPILMAITYKKPSYITYQLITLFGQAISLLAFVKLSVLRIFLSFIKTH